MQKKIYYPKKINETRWEGGGGGGGGVSQKGQDVCTFNQIKNIYFFYSPLGCCTRERE